MPRFYCPCFTTRRIVSEDLFFLFVVVFCWWVRSSLSLWFFIYCSKLLCCGFAVVKRKRMDANTGEQLTILEIWNLCALNTRIQVDFRISLDELTVHLPSGFHRQIMFPFLILLYLFPSSACVTGLSFILINLTIGNLSTPMNLYFL